jgi:hypothetical protein
MSAFLLLLLIGATAGIAFAVADMLVAPVVRGWRDDSRLPLQWSFAAPGTLAARLFDSLVAIALVTCLLLAFLLAGVL